MRSLLVLLALSACTAMTPAASSSAVLIPERTWVIVAKPAKPAALDVVRMFRMRGYALVDFQTNDRGLLLRFKGERKQVAEQIVTALDVLIAVGDVVEDLEASKKGREPRAHYHEPTIETYDLGSVFYVRVEPRGETMTSISAIGRPTRDGVEACTADPELDAPCAPLASGPDVHPDIAGLAEAELIDSVFAELRLEGSVVAPDVQVAEANHRCWRRQREVLAAAARVENPRAKANILRTAPNCNAVASN